MALKFGGKPAGLFVYHNTIICENQIGGTAANMHFRNNLFLGRDAPDRGIMRIGNSHSINSSDYNGYRPNKGVKEQYTWTAPPPGEIIYRPKREDAKTGETLAQLQAATRQESHSLEIDYDIFENLSAPDLGNPYAVYHAMDLNFRLKPGGRPIDAGEVIPTVNDDFVGDGPDLGAHEVGATEDEIRSTLVDLGAILPLRSRE